MKSKLLTLMFSLGMIYSFGQPTTNLGSGSGTQGAANVFIGSNAGQVTTGPYNAIVGSLAGQSNSSGLSNSFFGYASGYYNTTGSFNTFLGRDAGLYNTTGSNNTYLGNYAGFRGTGNSNNNTATGYQALLNSTGSNNSADGYNALFNTTTGSSNAGYGYQALYNNFTGSNNTALGNGADVGTDGLTNATAIGNGAIVNASNTIQLGNSSVTQVNAGTNATLIAGGLQITGGTLGVGKVLTSDANGNASWQTMTSGGPTVWNVSGSTINYTNGSVGIGTATPNYKLDVAGNIVNSNPSNGWIGLTGDLPGYAAGTYGTLKTNATYLYFSGGGKYSGYIGGDADAVLGLNDASANTKVSLNANGNSYLNGGNVGIGTTSPSALFHISSGVERNTFRLYKNTSTANYLSVWQGDAGAAIDPIGTGKLYLGYDQATDVYMNGNLGIGTTSPNAKLDVRGSLLLEAGDNPSLYTGTGSGELNRYLFLLNSPQAQSASGLKAGGVLVSDSYNYANPGKNDLIVKGNVGIGTASPAYKLDVSGIINASSIYINGVPFAGGGSQWTTVGTGINYAATGNVGIGAPSPSQKLEVDGGILQNADNSALGIDAQTNARLGFVKQSGSNPVIASDNGNPIIFAQTNQTGIHTNISSAKLTERMRIDANGNVGIGTTTTGSFKLAVEGKIAAREVQVTTAHPWPDYVFENDYKLSSLEDIKTYIDQNKHLPDVPSAKEIEKNGVPLGEMNAILLKKIEELTLHVIEQNKMMNEMRKEIKDLKATK